MLKKTSFICPFCFDQRSLRDAQFRCSNARCDNVDDVEMTIYEGGDPSLPMQGKLCFSEPSKNPFAVPQSARCPKCTQKTHKVVCPSCHNTLPDCTLRGRDMIISVVGARDTGKSHFVGVIIRELIDRISVAFGGSMVGFDDSYKRYMANFGHRLYNDLQKLELTRSAMGKSTSSAYRPLIFKYKTKSKGFLGSKIESFTFVFFDTAGEDLNAQDTMNTVNKYICRSAGIIFLLDPTKISAVKHQLDESTVSRASSASTDLSTDSDDIMSRVSTLIRNDRGLRETSKIDIPVAAVFSKFDVVAPVIPGGLTILETSPHCAEGAFVQSDWHNVNSEIHSLLTEWGASSFVSQLDLNYTRHSFFAASALGLRNNPREDDGIERPRPHRIEDALLWILYENKVIKQT